MPTILKNKTISSNMHQNVKKLDDALDNALDKRRKIIETQFDNLLPEKLEIRHELINTLYIINAEQYFINKFTDRGLKCYKTLSLVTNDCCNNKLIEFLKTEKRNGIPDLVVFNSDIFFFVEVKTGIQTLQKSQVTWIKNHTNIEVIIYYLSQKLVRENADTLKSYRDMVLSKAARNFNIRCVKAEYYIILDMLQKISPTTINELRKEINDNYKFELFTYKQIWDNIQSLIELGVIESNNDTKEISISPEYILHSESLPISSYCIYIFAISAILLLTSIATKTNVTISASMFLTGIIYLILQHYGSKFELNNV